MTGNGYVIFDKINVELGIWKWFWLRSSRRTASLVDIRFALSRPKFEQCTTLVVDVRALFASFGRGFQFFRSSRIVSDERYCDVSIFIVLFTFSRGFCRTFVFDVFRRCLLTFYAKLRRFCFAIRFCNLVRFCRIFSGSRWRRWWWYRGDLFSR